LIFHNIFIHSPFPLPIFAMIFKALVDYFAYANEVPLLLSGTRPPTNAERPKTTRISLKRYAPKN